MTLSDFDPRVWNLFAGVALVSAGCGSRLAGQDAGETGDTVDTTPEGPESVPECTSSSDCPYGYSCYDGVCDYTPHHDGHWYYYECYADEDCPQFEICNFGYCAQVDATPIDCLDPQEAATIPLPEAGVALSFADVDADGQDELVLASEASFQVLDALGNPPTISAREPGSIAAMVAGDFDPMPGEDVLVLLSDGETTMLYASLGDGSFAPPSTAVTVLPAVGLIAGDFDGTAPTDLLGWGAEGAFVVRGGEPLVFGLSPYVAAAAFGYGSLAPGYFLRGLDLEIFDLEGQPIDSVSGLDATFDIEAFVGPPGPRLADVVHFSGWSRVEVRDPMTAIQADGWAIPGTPTEILAGDLDGDGSDELVFGSASGVGVQFDPIGEANCWSTPSVPIRGTPRAYALGDYDGDGDDELAVLSSIGELALLDGG